MGLFINPGDSPLAPGRAGVDGAGHPDHQSLLELVLSLAQIQYEMESRRRSGLSADDLRAVEAPLIEELHRRGVPIPRRAPRATRETAPRRPAPMGRSAAPG